METTNVTKTADTPLVRGKGLMATHAEESRLKDYIKRVEWRLNRTMPDHPYCYIVVTQNPELESEFWFLAEMIAKYGIVEKEGEGERKLLYYRRQLYWRVYMHQAGPMIRRTGQDAQGPS